MVTTVPLSRLQRATTEITAIAAEQDVILDRRGAEALYLSTRERHDRSENAQRITTAMLAEVARSRPDLAGEAMGRTLPWMTWLPADDKVGCLTELLAQLRAGAETGELRPFELALEAWTSTAVACSDPAVLAELQRTRTSTGTDGGSGDVPFPGADGTAG